jgi:predicted dehydrogenase
MIRIGVIGLGYWGPNLVRNLSSLEDSSLVAIADQRPDKLSAMKERYPGLLSYSGGVDMLHAPSLDAVVIATPVSTHYDLAKFALLQGKHVLVEKPIATTARQVDELTELAKRQKRVLMVGHTYVYSGAIRLMKKLVEDGTLGDIWYYDSVRANLGRWQPDINVIWDLAPHDLSILAYVLTHPPLTVSATAACPMGPNQYSQDCLAHVILSWSEGIVGHLHLSWLSLLKMRRIIIGGSRGMLVYDPTVTEEVQLYYGGMSVQEAASYNRGEHRSLSVDLREPLSVECAHFVDCIRNGNTPLTDGRHASRVVRLLEAAHASSKAAGRPIEVTR